MSKKLKDKVALVTGASKGIGASIAKHLGAEGASVVVNYASSKEGADRVVAEIVKNGGKAVAVQANVGKLEDIKKLLKETLKAYGKVDILVNNAGVYEFASLEDSTPELYHKMFDLNVLGLLLMTKEVAKNFGNSGGSVINVSSVASIITMPNTTIYSATKAAVDAITKCLSKELGPRKIRVNSINPGLIETEGVHSGGFSGGDFQKQVESQTPLGRIGQPEDVATVAVFLASEDAKWVTGQTLFISGGLMS